MLENTNQPTPGPWRWFVQGNGDVYLATEHSGRLIVMDFVRHRMQSAIVRFRDHARCIMFKADHWVEDRSYGTVDHPDARLIAAAPDLLKELETAIAWIEEARPGLYAPTAKELLPQLRAAVMKARAPDGGQAGRPTKREG